MFTLMVITLTQSQHGQTDGMITIIITAGTAHIIIIGIMDGREDTEVGMEDMEAGMEDTTADTIIIGISATDGIILIIAIGIRRITEVGAIILIGDITTTITGEETGITNLIMMFIMAQDWEQAQARGQHRQDKQQTELRQAVHAQQAPLFHAKAQHHVVSKAPQPEQENRLLQGMEL